VVVAREPAHRPTVVLARNRVNEDAERIVLVFSAMPLLGISP